MALLDPTLLRAQPLCRVALGLSPHLLLGLVSVPLWPQRPRVYLCSQPSRAAPLGPSLCLALCPRQGSAERRDSQPRALPSPTGGCAALQGRRQRASAASPALASCFQPPGASQTPPSLDFCLSQLLVPCLGAAPPALGSAPFRAAGKHASCSGAATRGAAGALLCGQAPESLGLPPAHGGQGLGSG